jgi:hypothetical protein
MERKITFRKNQDNWEADGISLGFCNNGFRHYVELPPGVTSFTAVLTDHCPSSGNYFKLQSSSLDLADNLELYDRTVSNIEQLYCEGFRYAQILYAQ